MESFIWPEIPIPLACPVCFFAREGSRHAYYLITAVLTLLPLLLIGGIFFWILRTGVKR